MADAFGTAPRDDDLTHQCIQDLQPFCNAANEICEWAYEQVTSKGAFNDQLRTELKVKLDNANRAFSTISTIRTISAVFDLKRGVMVLLDYSERAARLKRIRDKFGSCIATQYQYQDQGKQECDEATRAGVLKQLDSWIHDSSIDKANRCWWMTGIAGVGKTAIAMSTVQCLLDRQPLSSDMGEMDVYMDDTPILFGQYFCNVKLDQCWPLRP